jgi:Domain of unknown function (DUF4404)
MSQPHLHKLLTELHAELLAARSVDPEDRELLQHLAADIRAVVEAGPAAPAATRGDLRRRLGEAVGRFEASHPELAKALATAIDTLALYNL